MGSTTGKSSHTSIAMAQHKLGAAKQRAARTAKQKALLNNVPLRPYLSPSERSVWSKIECEANLFSCTSKDFLQWSCHKEAIEALHRSTVHYLDVANTDAMTNAAMIIATMIESGVSQRINGDGEDRYVFNFLSTVLGGRGFAESIFRLGEVVRFSEDILRYMTLTETTTYDGERFNNWLAVKRAAKARAKMSESSEDCEKQIPEWFQRERNYSIYVPNVYDEFISMQMQVMYHIMTDINLNVLRGILDGIEEKSTLWLTLEKEGLDVPLCSSAAAAMSKNITAMRLIMNHMIDREDMRGKDPSPEGALIGANSGGW